jgi:hypothetical protein
VLTFTCPRCDTLVFFDSGNFGELVRAWLPCRVGEGATVDRIAS